MVCEICNEEKEDCAWEISPWDKECGVDDPRKYYICQECYHNWCMDI